MNVNVKANVSGYTIRDVYGPGICVQNNLLYNPACNKSCWFSIILDTERIIRH